MKHGPYCIPPDEVGDPGTCCCDGTDETIGAMQREYDAKRNDCESCGTTHPATHSCPDL